MQYDEGYINRAAFIGYVIKLGTDSVRVGEFSSFTNVGSGCYDSKTLRLEKDGIGRVTTRRGETMAQVSTQRLGPRFFYFGNNK